MTYDGAIIFALLAILLVVSCSPAGAPAPETPAASFTEEPTTEPTPEISQLYQNPDDCDITIKVYGIERRFLLHVPPGYQPGEPAPLVYNLHAAGGSAHGQANRSFINDKADIETWQGCDEGVTVRLVSRIDGAHVWPGSDITARRENVATAFNATDAIWDFFEAYPKNLSSSK